MRIQPINETDYESAFSLMRKNMGVYHELHELPWDQDWVDANYLDKENHSVFQDDVWIGFLSLEWKEDSVFIHTLQLSHAVQGGVFGIQALNWLIDRSQDNGIDIIDCKAFASSPVVALYKKIGFETQKKDGLFLELRMDLAKGQLPTTWRRFGNRNAPRYPSSVPDNSRLE